MEYLSKLCYNDLRNPDGIKDTLSEEYGYTKEEISTYGNFKKEECYCDNCFYGRTVLAEKILELELKLKN